MWVECKGSTGHPACIYCPARTKHTGLALLTSVWFGFSVCAALWPTFVTFKCAPTAILTSSDSVTSYWFPLWPWIHGWGGTRCDFSHRTGRTGYGTGERLLRKGSEKRKKISIFRPLESLHWGSGYLQPIWWKHLREMENNLLLKETKRTINRSS